MPKRRKGGTPQNFRNNFQPIPLEAAWHPRCGAPKGNRNAWAHGAYGREIEDLKKRARKLVREANATLALLREQRKAEALAQRNPPT